MFPPRERGAVEVEFRVLGPVEVRVAGRPVPSGEPRQRAVLAVLLLHAGRAVNLDTMIDRVWGDSAPRQARRSVYAYIARLRRALDEAIGAEPAEAADQPLIRTSGGYLLDVDPEQVDVLWFRSLVTRSRDTDLPDQARAAALRSALDLWRGDPLGGVSGPWADRMRDTLREERVEALVAWANAEIMVGGATTVLGPLTELAEERPLLEPAAAALMRASYAVGRVADALDRYDKIRHLLREELGVDPGPDLQAAHRAILRQELPVPARPGAVVRPVPAQLPADVPAFTGRAVEVAELDRLLPVAASDGQSLVVCLTGTAGAGKTALAIHWGHRRRERFTDGQLYLNLRGYDPELPMAAVDALGTLLASVVQPGQAIPAGLEERAARFRTELAGRRMLIVLDNASTVEIVRHLLPGASECTVVVTSRDSLAGLVSINGARRITVDLLPSADAIELLRQLVGTRVDEEPVAAATLVEQCAQLPLALRIAAELAAARPAASLSTLTTELAEQQRRLDLLSDSDDPRAGIGAVFSWSLRQLPAPSVRTFALLGLHPGPHLDVFAAAALVDNGLDEVRRTLASLARAHLIYPVEGSRYGIHDLLRAYAARLAGERWAVPDIAAPMARLFDYYLGTASVAMQALYPGEADRRPPVPAPDSPMPDLGDAAAAHGWLRTELPNLTAIAVCAAAHKRHAPAVRASAVLYRYLDGDHYNAAVTIHGTARTAAQRLGDESGEAHALNALAHAHAQAGRLAKASQYLQEAQRLSERAGDEVGQARALGNLAGLDEQLARYEDAAVRYEQAMHRYHRLGDLTGQAHALTRLASVEARLGRDRPSREHVDRALALHRQAGHRFGEAWALNSLGEIEARAGRHELAADWHRQALMLFRELGHRSSEAWTLDSLGASETRLDRFGRARDHHQRALDMFRELSDQFGQAASLNGLGEALLAARQAGLAIAYHAQALTLATGTGAREQQARAHAGLGEAHRADGDAASAREHFQQALAGYADLSLAERVVQLRARLDH
jgi:DNA-binding SARP family transcriptional activator/tetratricopeptide (TPR) repeat protein